MDDFMKITPGKTDNETPNGPDPAELRLFYVALTRAKNAVQVPDHLLAMVGQKSANRDLHAVSPYAHPFSPDVRVL